MVWIGCSNKMNGFHLPGARKLLGGYHTQSNELIKARTLEFWPSGLPRESETELNANVTDMINGSQWPNPTMSISHKLEERPKQTINVLVSAGLLVRPFNGYSFRLNGENGENH
jgi:hypothetical protein